MTTPKYEPHPYSAIFPPMKDDDFDKLVADIKANGLHQPIVMYQGKILDGNNRYRACSLAGIEPKFLEYKGDDAQAKVFVISANIHRRHLTPAQKRDLIQMLILIDPSKSNRQIAEEAKVSHHTVGDVRTELEAGGQIAHQEKVVGKDGVAQPATKKGKGGKRGKSGAKSETEKITYQKVVNAKTALNAYSVLEEHLLDALRDIEEQSDFSQADDCARRTIEKLEECLGQMQETEEEVAA
jgi:ParB-like chromosome segregation protein Spo0J